MKKLLTCCLTLLFFGCSDGGSSGGAAGSAGQSGAGGTSGAGGEGASGGMAGGAGGSCVCTAESVVNCGHRGTGSNSDTNPFPENTIESVLRAFEEGAEITEIDVLHSGDGTIVLLHDDTVDRTTDGTGCAGDLTVSELQALDAAAGTSLEGTGVVIPTLAEVMSATDGSLNIEIKIKNVAACPDTDRPRLAADLAALIQADTESRRIHVSSFDAEMLDAIKAVDPGIEVGFLSFNTPAAIMLAAERGFDGVNVNAGAVADADVAAARDAGLDVNVWTVNDPTRMRELIDMEVDMVITDEPDVFAGVRGAACNEACP